MTRASRRSSSSPGATPTSASTSSLCWPRVGEGIRIHRWTCSDRKGRPGTWWSPVTGWTSVSNSPRCRSCGLSVIADGLMTTAAGMPCRQPAVRPGRRHRPHRSYAPDPAVDGVMVGPPCIDVAEIDSRQLGRDRGVRRGIAGDGAEGTPLAIGLDGDGDPLVGRARVHALGDGVTLAPVPAPAHDLARQLPVDRSARPPRSAPTRPWWPRPSGHQPSSSRHERATRAAKAACSPPSGSPAPRTRTGGPSGCPVSQAMPVSDSMVWAKPGRSRHGPSRPKAGMRTMQRAGVHPVQVVPAQPELVHHPGGVVLDHHVGRGQQLR